MYLIYRTRHLVSWLPALLVAGSILFSSQQAALKVAPRYDDTSMTLALVEEIPEPEIAMPPQPEPAVEPPPAPAPEPEPAPPVEPVAPAPEPIIAAPPPPPPPKVKTKAEPRPKPEAQEKPRPAAAPARATVRQAPATPAAVSAPARPAAPLVNVQALENGYLQTLRNELDALKRYPTGRQASLERPQGNVEVWLEVDRSGRVLNSGIASRHRSMLLNRAATSSLQNLRQVKPFPEQAFAGQTTKRFTATFNYQAP